mgnify:FL=1
MARFSFARGNLHRYGIELTIIPFDVRFHERFELFGAGHFCYLISAKKCPIRGYGDDAVLRIGGNQ